MTNSRFGLTMEERGDVHVALLSGELDLAVTRQTGERLAEQLPTAASGLVLDLTEVAFIDSSGVAMLFGLVRRLASRRQRLSVVVSPQGPVARVLELVDFPRAAPVAANLDEAVTAVAGS